VLRCVVVIERLRLLIFIRDPYPDPYLSHDFAINTPQHAAANATPDSCSCGSPIIVSYYYCLIVYCSDKCCAEWILFFHFYMCTLDAGGYLLFVTLSLYIDTTIYIIIM